MDLCSIFAILPMVCNDPKPEPVEEQAPAANELVIEAQPAPSVAASSIEPSEGPALPSLSSYLNEDLVGPAPEPVEEPVAASTARGNPALALRPQEVEQIPQVPDMADIDAISAVEGDMTIVATTSGAEVVAIRPDNPDEAAVFVMPARIENVPANAPELEGPFDNPTDLEEYLNQPRHRRSHQVERLDIDS